MNFDKMATAMQIIGCVFASETDLELSVASNRLSNVGVCIVSSFHIAPHENDRSPFFDLSRRIELVFLELRTFNSLCIKRPSLIKMISLYFGSSTSSLTIDLRFPRPTYFANLFRDGVRWKYFGFLELTTTYKNK